jgi:hypothetical protein
VTTSMAEVGFVRSMPFFIMMVVPLMRSDENNASAIAMNLLRFSNELFFYFFDLPDRFLPHFSS